MKSKRGFLLAEETLKIVIAVICVGILIYFLSALYFSKINSQKLKEAEQLLKESGSGSIKALLGILGEGNSSQFQLRNPKGWYLFGFIDKKPNSCAGKSCLCICDGVWIDNFLFWQDKQLKECDEDGTCLVVENLKAFDKIEIKQQFITIKKENNIIEVVE